MEINFSNIRTNYKKLGLEARNFLAAKGLEFLILIAVVLLAYGGYLWYKFIFHPQWSEGRKQEYMNTQEKETVFNQNKFSAVIGEIEARKNEYNKKIENIPDIFKLKQ